MADPQVVGTARGDSNSRQPSGVGHKASHHAVPTTWIIVLRHEEKRRTKPVTIISDTNEFKSDEIEVTDSSQKAYSLEVTGEDAVGNPLKPTTEDEGVTAGGMRRMPDNATTYSSQVVVDTEAPKVEVSYSADGIAETALSYNKNDASAVFTGSATKISAKFTEDNFDSSKVSIQYLSDDGITYVDVKNVVWSEDNTNTATFTLPAVDGENTTYKLKIDAKDLAANQVLGDGYAAMPYEAMVVVDKKAPTLQISFDGNPAFYENDRYYNASVDKVTASVKIEDDGSGLKKDDFAITCADGTVKKGDVVSSGGKDTLEATIEMKKVADAEKEYTIKVSGQDIAKNNLEKYVPEETGQVDETVKEDGDGAFKSLVVCDAKSPKIYVTWGDNAAVKNGKYFKSNRQAEIKITETYFRPTDIDVSEPESDQWTTVGTEHSINSKTFVNNIADQSLTVSGTDIAGNKLVAANAGGVCDDMTGDQAGSCDDINDINGYKSALFVVDTVAPKVATQLNLAPTRTVSSTDFFKGANTIEAKIAVIDDHFSATAEDESVVTPSGQVADAGEWAGNEYKMVFNPHTAYETLNTINATIYDLAGNSVEYRYGNAANYNSTVDANGNALSGANFALDVTAPAIVAANKSTNNIASRMYSGNLHSGSFLFYKDPTSLNLAVEDALGVYDGSSNSTVFPATLNAASNIQTSRNVPAINLTDNNEFTRSFVFTTQDCAGNSSAWSLNPGLGTATRLYNSINLYPEALIQDTRAPQVSWSGVTAGQYYNSDQSATLSINEKNFRYLQEYNGSVRVATQNKQEGNSGRAQSSQVINASNMNAVDRMGGRYSRSLSFNTDGHYTLSAQFNDPAGNASNLAEVQEFTIDKTAPRVEVSWDNNNARNGNYYNSARTATVTITEHNFEASGFRIETTGSVGGWSSNGDVHTATVSFGTDGRYTMTVSGADKAGNALQTYTEPEFVIDLTNPQITFSLVEDKSAYNRDSFPGVAITYTDEANLDTAALTKTLTGAKHGIRSEFGSTGAGSAGNSATDTYTPESFPDEVESDDIYTLTAHMADMAGNEADGTIMFSLNRYGSNFIVEDEDAYKDGYLAEAQEVLVREINVTGSDSEEHGVTVTHGLNTENLERETSGSEEDSGFYIESGEDNSGWASYLYHIGAGNFEDDGNYHVVISSTDITDNLNNSANYYDPEEHETADAEVSFILDTTPPMIDGLSVASGGVYDGANHPVTFSIIDNIGYEKVAVNLDGSDLSEDEMSVDTGGVCTVNVSPESFRPRDMVITVSDYAGHTATTSVNGFRITTNALELNTPLMVGGGIVLVAAVAGAVVFIRRRRGL